MVNAHGSGESLVQCITWNTKGMNGAVKRSRVLTHLKKLKADIIFLEETHMTNQDHGCLRKGWVGQVYHSRFQFPLPRLLPLFAPNLFLIARAGM